MKTRTMSPIYFFVYSKDITCTVWMGKQRGDTWEQFLPLLRLTNQFFLSTNENTDSPYILSQHYDGRLATLTDDNSTASTVCLHPLTGSLSQLRYTVSPPLRAVENPPQSQL